MIPTVDSDLLDELEQGSSLMAGVWSEMIPLLGLTGMTVAICHQLKPVNMGGGILTFEVSEIAQPMLMPATQLRITAAIQAKYPMVESVHFVPAATTATASIAIH